MRITPIAQQLAGMAVKRIGGAIEFAALKYEPNRLPALFVVPDGWAAGPSRLTQIVDQKISDQFWVVVIINAAARAGAEAISEELEDLQTDVLQRLVGWTHPDATMPVTAVSAHLMSADGTTLTWGIKFSSSHHLRKAG